MSQPETDRPSDEESSGDDLVSSDEDEYDDIDASKSYGGRDTMKGDMTAMTIR